MGQFNDHSKGGEMMNSNFKERIAQLSSQQQQLLLEKLRLFQINNKQHKSNAKKKKIVAYVKSSEAVAADLKLHTKECLPDYMVPAAFVIVNEFPRLPNGKIDLNTLQSFNEEPYSTETEFVEPTSLLEKKLAAIWEEVLDFAPIGIHDNFFEIGGDSILSIQIISKIRNEGIVLAANQLFEHQSIGELASFIELEKQELVEEKESGLAKESESFPLTSMQEAFLFHHLQEKIDQGILHADLILEGPLDLDRLDNAWQQTIQRHAVLRTSVRWQEVEKSIQIVQPQATIKLNYKDLSGLDRIRFNQQLEQIKKGIVLDLTTAPVSEVHVVKKGENNHILVWSSHHLLLDGWSTALIIKDLFSFYGDVHGKSYLSKGLPSFKAYMDWIGEQDKAAAKIFWRKTMADMDAPALFKKSTQPPTPASFQDHIFHLSLQQTEELKAFARQLRITPSTIIKGLWGLLLSSYFEKDTVTFGTTVSGRSAPLQDIDKMTGLFMNILPVQLNLNPEMDFSRWIKEVQITFGQSINFEYNTLPEIQLWSGIESSSLFDSLIVFENYPWEDLEERGLKISGFKGGVTTSYPLNLMVIPIDAYEFIIRYDENILNDKVAEWFAKELHDLLAQILVSHEINLLKLSGKITPPSFEKNKNQQEVTTKKQRPFVVPEGKDEVTLVKIWEKVLDFNPIGVTDNFFEIGGTSLKAVRLLSMVKDSMGYNLSPAKLIEYPTVRQLASVFQKGEEEWSVLVPLRTNGSKTPLFCIHAGGGHTFFYRNLLPYLSSEQPVYSIQAMGLDTGTMHQNAEDMARDYIKAVKKVQPEGPYIFLVYCFSIVVGMEISKQLQAEGAPPPMIIAVDTAPFIPKTKRLTLSERISRYVGLSMTEKWEAIIEKVRSRSGMLVYKGIKKFGNQQESLLIKTQETLIKIYDNYERVPFKGQITLIRSNKTIEEMKERDWHMDGWNSLAIDGVDVYVVEGTHETLFEEPDVAKVARQVQICIDKLSEIS